MKTRLADQPALRCPARGRPAVRLFLFLVLGLLLFPTPARAQMRVPFGQDDHALRYILDQKEMTPLTDPGQVAEDSSKTLVIVLGDLSALDDLPHGLRGFLRDGGAVLAATDRRSVGALHQDFRTWVQGGRVVKGSEAGYRDLQYCPLVTSFYGRHPIFQGIRAVATNSPSYLYFGRLRALARYSPGVEYQPQSEPGRPRKEVPAPDRFQVGFAAGDDVGKGRLLVLSDHSVFINDMMLQPDNDNFDFAYNCVDWLSDHGRRKRVLFLDEGRLIADFKVPLKSVPNFPVPPVEVIDEMLTGLEEENEFNRLILENVDFRRVYSALILLATVGVTGVGLYYFARAKGRVEAETPLSPAGPSAAAAAVPVIQQRHQELHEEGNYWEVARELARQALQEAGCPPPREGEETVPPQIMAEGAWQERKDLQQLVEELWQLAYGGQPRKVPAGRFDRVRRQAGELTAAAADGRVNWTSEESA